ncbi:hypothetical protein HHI36_007904 [Cryptolaemus montrouzieri]|uniref:Uncharacterized protein n=1 Tax=Cryptolaemus montrouzieri TaxID=559131 RepID=A0ABD2MR58_9CUCU
MASYISEEKIRRQEIALQKQENMPMSTPSAVEASVSGTEPVRKSSRASLKFEKDSKYLICGKQTRNKNETLYLCSEISAAEQILKTARKKQDDVFTKISTCVHPVDLFAMEGSTENKLQISRFLCAAAPRYIQVKEDCELYVSGGFDDPTKCFKLQASSFCEVPDLKCNHLKADSRMFSHIFHAARIQCAHIIIVSADTDVFILGIHFWSKLARLGCLGLWFDGSYKKKYMSGCHLAAQSLGENIFCQHYTL